MQSNHPVQDASPTPTAQSVVAIVDTARSPHAVLRPVSLRAVTLNDRFWAPRRQVNRAITLPSQYQRLEETGRMDNLRRAAGARNGPFIGRYFNDSDVYKWFEAVAWTLATEPSASLDALADQVIAEIAAAQQPNGYLNSYFMFEHEAERWTNFDLHEMYCAGHLFQAAVAHYRATGKTALLDVATRFADHICDTFGPEEQGKRFGIDGHPEVEMALIEMYRVTGNRRYLDQVHYFIDVRGHRRLPRPYDRFDSAYHQDHMPFRDLSRMEGHAVRALYLNAGATDLSAEADDAAIRAALDRMWTNMTTTQSYITGGVGSRYEGEAFGKDYELPNGHAYTETCAAIASVMWAWRMLELTADAHYADVIEQTLYNGMLSGISLHGDTYFYQNPLADDGTHRRQPWFGTACCPPNVARLLASLPGYFYNVSEAGVWVHLYAEGTAQIALPDGRSVALAQHTNYPWDGEITIDVMAEGPFSLFVRIPAWCESGATLAINGSPWPAPLKPGTYAQIRRMWSDGDQVQIQLPMAVRRIVSHPYATENTSRVAIMRGPLLYCIEAVDHSDIDVRDVVLTADAPLTATLRPDLLGGVVVITGPAAHTPPTAWQSKLYQTAPVDPAPQMPTELTAIPYYAWANRDAGPMQVWLRTT